MNDQIPATREGIWLVPKKRLSADLLIVECNPAKNISDTRNVKHVFLRGKQVDRDSLKIKN